MLGPGKSSVDSPRLHRYKCGKQDLYFNSIRGPGGISRSISVASLTQLWFIRILYISLIAEEKLYRRGCCRLFEGLLREARR